MESGEGGPDPHIRMEKYPSAADAGQWAGLVRNGDKDSIVQNLHVHVHAALQITTAIRPALTLHEHARILGSSNQAFPRCDRCNCNSVRSARPCTPWRPCWPRPASMLIVPILKSFHSLECLLAGYRLYAKYHVRHALHILWYDAWCKMKSCPSSSSVRPRGFYSKTRIGLI